MSDRLVARELPTRLGNCTKKSVILEENRDSAGRFAPGEVWLLELPDAAEPEEELRVLTVALERCGLTGATAGRGTRKSRMDRFRLGRGFGAARERRRRLVLPLGAGKNSVMRWLVRSSSRLAARMLCRIRSSF